LKDYEQIGIENGAAAGGKQEGQSRRRGGNEAIDEAELESKPIAFSLP